MRSSHAACQMANRELADRSRSSAELKMVTMRSQNQLSLRKMPPRAPAGEDEDDPSPVPAGELYQIARTPATMPPMNAERAPAEQDGVQAVGGRQEGHDLEPEFLLAESDGDERQKGEHVDGQTRGFAEVRAADPVETVAVERSRRGDLGLVTEIKSHQGQEDDELPQSLAGNHDVGHEEGEQEDLGHLVQEELGLIAPVDTGRGGKQHGQEDDEAHPFERIGGFAGRTGADSG